VRVIWRVAGKLDWAVMGNFALATQVAGDVVPHLRWSVYRVGIRKCWEGRVEMPVVAR
jgi:hypothetical protein